MEKLEIYQKIVKNSSASAIVDWALETFGTENLLLASSLSSEDQVLTDIFAKKTVSPRIFTLDTGRLFQETYDLMDESMKHYRFQYEVCFPNTKDVIELISEKGPNLFYRSINDRKQCCYVRKVRPLSQILKTAKAWMTGLRAEQSVTRSSLELVEWDEAFGLYKINPLAHWTSKDIWHHIEKNNVPHSVLYKRGYLSIGCFPCTRPVQKGQPERSGRWWWEEPETKECGLHKRSVFRRDKNQELTNRDRT